MKQLRWYFRFSLLVRILIGLILGAVCGLVFGPAMAWVSPFGEIFIRLLKMIVMPVIFFCLLFGIGLAYARNSEDEQIRQSGETVFRFFNGGAEIM